MIKVYLDTEFTGLHQDTTLISLGLVAETGETFYAEFTDYDVTQVELDPWLKENVIKHLEYTGAARNKIMGGVNDLRCVGNSAYILNCLEDWLVDVLNIQNEDKFEVWSDCLAYDWVLFCQLWGGALNLPKYISYIPQDICTLARVKGLDPDFNRKEYSELTDVHNHNAFDDALMIKACYDKMMKPKCCATPDDEDKPKPIFTYHIAYGYSQYVDIKGCDEPRLTSGYGQFTLLRTEPIRTSDDVKFANDFITERQGLTTCVINSWTLLESTLEEYEKLYGKEESK